MKPLFIILATVLFIGGCSNAPADKADATTKATEHITDSMGIINDSTQLPRDSMSTGVQH